MCDGLKATTRAGIAKHNLCQPRAVDVTLGIDDFATKCRNNRLKNSRLRTHDIVRNLIRVDHRAPQHSKHARDR